MQWYLTCGDSLCLSPGPDAGTLTNDAGAPCPRLGTSCSTQGESCGTHNSYVQCGSIEECSATNPAVGCPRSSRRFKDDIHYVDSDGLKTLHDQTLRMRLATYRYKPEIDDPNPQHLGFIIEDTPASSPAVNATCDRADLYGYLSMVVGAMQVQEKEIAELRRRLESAESGVCARPASVDPDSERRRRDKTE